MAWSTKCSIVLKSIARIALVVACGMPCAGTAGAGELDTLLFGSLDAGAAQFLTTGVKLGFAPLDQEGFVVLASLGGGRRDESRSNHSRQRYTVGAAAVLGYQLFYEWGVVAAFLGPEIATEMVVDRPRFARLPLQPGLRLQGELWARPTEMTLVQATAVAGSARSSLWVRVAGGYRMWGAYLGPEIGAYIDATGYRKWNLGLHGTDFDVGRFSARVSVGVQTENGRRAPSPYLAVSVWTPW